MGFRDFYDDVVQGINNGSYKSIVAGYMAGMVFSAVFGAGAGYFASESRDYDPSGSQRVEKESVEGGRTSLKGIDDLLPNKENGGSLNLENYIGNRDFERDSE